MDEVRRALGSQLNGMAKQCILQKHSLLHVASELFSDKISVSRIAFFLALAEKIIELHPEMKCEVHEDVFTSILKNMKFK